MGCCSLPGVLRSNTAIVLLLWLLSSSLLAEETVDQDLKQLLIAALAEQPLQKDRFDIAVWLTDYDHRLQKLLPDISERLEILQYVYMEAHRAELDPELVLAVIYVESRFDRFAISSAGARGLMQIMPFWLDELQRPDDNLFDIATNLRFGCTILRHYLDIEKGNMTKALARYNGSRGSYRYPSLVYKALRRYWYKS